MVSLEDNDLMATMILEEAVDNVDVNDIGEEKEEELGAVQTGTNDDYDQPGLDDIEEEIANDIDNDGEEGEDRGGEDQENDDPDNNEKDKNVFEDKNCIFKIFS